MTITWNRVLSAVVAGAYVAVGFLHGGSVSAFEVGIFTIFPLSCIWFAEEMGGYTGSTNSVAITARSPRFLVCLFGWVLLLLPIIVIVVQLLDRPA